MLSTTYRPRAAARRPQWLGPAVGFLVVAVPVLLLIVYWGREIVTAPSFDKDWCIENQLATSAAIVLGDRTDPYSDRQRAAVDKVFEPFAAKQAPSLPVRARLTVMTFDGDTKGFPRVVDSFCRPPLIAQESETGATKTRLEPAYERYVTRVHDAFDKMTTDATKSDWSPIFEAIREVARRSELGPGVNPRRLVIASDFLQSVPYQLTEADNAHLTLAAFLKTPYAQQVRADLRGVTIDVLYLQRRRAIKLQTPTHQQFVKDWLTAMGGDITSFDTVPE